MTTEKQLEKGISEIVGVFMDPILVFPGGWGDTLPEWLKEAITMERLMMNIGVLKGEAMTGTDAEACAYLMTVSLTQPMDSDWSEIYLYVANQVVRRNRKTEIPQDIVVESLSDYQMQHLNRLKAWLYERHIKAREEKERAKRREIQEEQETKKKDEQPALFEF